ncbi:MAG: proteasome accessory factor PafA2 family protein [Nanoarchaeota archaeon]
MTRRSPPDVMGLETELGVQHIDGLHDIKDEILKTSLLKEGFFEPTGEFELKINYWLPNGGRIYRDMKMWEICTPETRTIRDFLIWQRAMERIIVRAVRDHPEILIYKNNVDAKTSWGSHMNYTTTLSLSQRIDLVLPAVLEKLITGSGNLRTYGQYDISQRAKVTTKVHPELVASINPEGPIDTSQENKRFLIDGRDERTDNHREYLFHHTSNDSNMLDNAEWLKVGFMRNMIALAENGCLPKIEYNPREAIEDLRHLTTIEDIQEDPLLTQNRWHIRSMPPGERSALNLLKKYNDRARSELSGKDAETDFTIELTDYVITSLQRFGQDPNQLYGVLDWVTKRHLLAGKMKNESLLPNNEEIRSVNLEYHCLNSGSLFQDLKSMGGIEIVPTEAEVRNAIMNPPTNTRAYARGNVAKQEMSKFGSNLSDIDWNTIVLHTGKTIRLPDPRNNYADILSEILLRTR